MTEDDLVKELWSIANVMTGFSVVQSLGFLVALCKDLKELPRKPIPVKIILGGLFAVFAAFYTVGILDCYGMAMHVKNGDSRDGVQAIWLQVTIGRIACIWLFTIAQIFGLFGRDIFRKYVA